MSSQIVITGGVLLGLWPFGAEEPGAQNVGSLRGETAVDASSSTVKADSDRARQHYARFLELESGADPAMRSIALRRLGDLTLERAESRLLDDGMGPAVLADLDQAESLYRSFVAEFPDDDAVGRVLYQLARALDLKGQTDSSLLTLETLARRAEASADENEAAMLSEAQFRRGEGLFAARNWAAAEQAYKAVMTAKPASAFLEQATYKHGWSLFKQGRHEESLESFFAILDHRVAVDETGESNLDSMDRPVRELVDDTLRAVCIGFAYMDGPASLNPYLASRGSTPYERLVYVRLGELYLEQERYQDAAETYRAYVNANAGDRYAPEMQILVIQAFEAGDFPALVLEGKTEYVERFGSRSDYWQSHDWNEMTVARDYLRTSLGELGRHFHATAQESEDPADYAAASRWYEDWLVAFPEDPEAPETHFLLAELRFEAGQYESAAVAYEHTAYGYVDHDRSAEAGYAALLAWRRQTETDPEGPWRMQGIDSALRFAATFPQHENAASVQTVASEELFELGQLEQAAAAAQDLLAMSEGGIQDSHRKTALLVLGHASFDLGEFAVAESAYTQSLNYLEDDEQTASVRERLAASIYSQASAVAATDPAMAVEHYQRVRFAVPESAIAATADYDAAILLMQTDRWQLAAESMADFRQRYPDHELQDQVTVNLATAWLESGDKDAAAGELVRVSRLASEDPEVRRAALWQAVELYTETGDEAQARVGWIDYVERFPQPRDPAMEARNALVELYKKQGDAQGTIKWLNAIVAADREAGSAASGRSKSLAAHATLELSEPDRQAFEMLTLDAPLEKSLARKKAMMETVLAGYADAAEYGISEVTTQATFRVAQIYRDFGTALMDSERPSDLDEAALEEYEFLLEEQAFPFEEQAIAVHRKNADRARDGVYDEWVAASFDHLAELVPGRYARQEKGERLVRLASH